MRTLSVYTTLKLHRKWLRYIWRTYRRGFRYNAWDELMPSQRYMRRCYFRAQREIQMLKYDARMRKLDYRDALARMGEAERLGPAERAMFNTPEQGDLWPELEPLRTEQLDIFEVMK